MHVTNVVGLPHQVVASHAIHGFVQQLTAFSLTLGALSLSAPEGRATLVSSQLGDQKFLAPLPPLHTFRSRITAWLCYMTMVHSVQTC